MFLSIDAIDSIDLQMGDFHPTQMNSILNSFSVYFAKPTLSFINRPLQTGYGRNGVHELGNGPKLSIGDLGLPQIPTETEFLILDLEKVNRRNR